MFSYNNERDAFSITRRRSLSHNMPSNHFHSTFELFYLVSGERCFFIKDRTLQIKEGDLVLVQPNVLHRTTNAGLPKHERIIVNFQEDFIAMQKFFLSQVLRQIFDKEYTVISLSPQHRIHVEDLLQQIQQEVQGQNTGFEVYVKTLVLQILVYICRLIEQNSVKPLAYSSPIHEKVSEIVRYINSHYSQNLSLHYLADRFYISPYYLSRIFKEVTGFTFVEYLNSVRVKEAKKLLEISNLKVNVIAEKVGFGSITHFGRVFREITGHAPLHYRKQGKLSGE